MLEIHANSGHRTLVLEKNPNQWMCLKKEGPLNPTDVPTKINNF